MYDERYDITPAVVPHQSKGCWPRIANTFWAACHQGDINHITGDVHYLALLLRANRTVLTIHDCCSLERLTGIKRWLMQILWFALPIRRSAAVTVVSEETKRQLLRYVRVSENKVFVIPNTISPVFRRCDRTFRQECPRILHIGTKENKNLTRLVTALRGLRCHLHIIGSPSEKQMTELQSAGVRFDISSNLSELGVYDCYCNADLVAFVSTYEGFGMPIIEANAVGRPVVTSNTSSMPEIAGRAACFVDPFDIDSIRNGIQRVIKEKDYREQIVLNGFENVRRFHPATVASKYIALYRRICAVD
jgi:glycosyltransferase involved in cell wall biosynthesis